MTDDELAMARRVAKAPGWRWVEGMIVAEDRSEPGVKRPWVRSAFRVTGANAVPGATCIPDLDDVLTRAGLAVVARVAWGCATMFALPVFNFTGGLAHWRVYNHIDALDSWDGPTEAAAWVEAICAAPAKP